jgi:hypothetical protein
MCPVPVILPSSLRRPRPPFPSASFRTRQQTRSERLSSPISLRPLASSNRLIPSRWGSIAYYLSLGTHSLTRFGLTQIKINRVADHWLGDPKSAYSRAFATSIREEWGIEPLWIREGGSIPSVSFLAGHFGVEAVHVPLGQSSDSAHLPNERIRILNLEVRPSPFSYS